MPPIALSPLSVERPDIFSPLSFSFIFRLFQAMPSPASAITPAAAEPAPRFSPMLARRFSFHFFHAACRRRRQRRAARFEVRRPGADAPVFVSVAFMPRRRASAIAAAFC
jgi:hypothetical protein